MRPSPSSPSARTRSSRRPRSAITPPPRNDHAANAADRSHHRTERPNATERSPGRNTRMSQITRETFRHVSAIATAPCAPRQAQTGRQEHEPSRPRASGCRARSTQDAASPPRRLRQVHAPEARTPSPITPRPDAHAHSHPHSPHHPGRRPSRCSTRVARDPAPTRPTGRRGPSSKAATHGMPGTDAPGSPATPTTPPRENPGPRPGGGGIPTG
jgi:hypothetical protein